MMQAKSVSMLFISMLVLFALFICTILIGILSINPPSLLKVKGGNHTDDINQQLLTRQQVENPNNFHPPIQTSQTLPLSILQCHRSLLACAEHVLSQQKQDLLEETDNSNRLKEITEVIMGKQINVVQLFVYHQRPASLESQPLDIGVVVITEQVKNDVSVVGIRHRIAFIQKKGKSYWRYVSHRYQWQCARTQNRWSNKLCP